MIAILYPLKMDKNLYEAYSAIYEISANKAISAAKEAEKTRAQKAKAGDTEGAKKAMGQNKKFFNYAKGKRQQENAPKKPTGPMANKPTPDPTSSYPGTPQIMKQGKMVKNSYEPEGEVIDEKLSKEQQAKYDAHVNKKREEDKKIKKTGNPAFDDPSHHSFAKSKIKKNIFDSYDNRYSDNTGKESEEKKKKLEKKRGMKLDNHPQFKREGKYRSEWEQLKLMEMDDYRESFDEWITSIVEEGYDIERWTDEEMIDTFISELNLYNAEESVYQALLSDGELSEAKDKKGKGSGTKDACYHKVKARYDVWPSAYGSGALSKCRKVGAANWGNKSKKEDFSDWRSDIQLDELNKQERMETAVRGGGGVGKRFAKKLLGKQAAGKTGKMGYDHRGRGNVGRRNIERFENKPTEREEGSLDKKRRQSFKKVNVLNPKSGYSKKSDAVGAGKKVTSRKLSTFGSDMKRDYGPQKHHTQGNTSRDAAQAQRGAEHKARRGVKTKGTDTADMKKALKDDYNYVNDYAMQLEKVGMIQTALKPVTKAITRQAIKVGGKTGGKIAKAGMQAAGNAVKDQVKNTAVAAGAGMVNKAAEKVRNIGKPKPQVNQLPPSQQTSM